MCGIVGIASTVPIELRDWLRVGADALRHRGPDDAGEWWSDDGRVGLGHRRLAIIDLSAAGRQPMANADRTARIVFNGELYNFRDLRAELVGKGVVFRSESDTEVVLAAYLQWGTECLSRFNGMFAFAIFDGARQVLFLARDRAGEKPLFYRLSAGTLRFASELKGLLADPQTARSIDHEALDCYLAMGYVPAERCILRGSHKLPPAHALELNLATGASRTWRYWRPPEFQKDQDARAVDEPSLMAELEGLLQDSVRRQLVADVPVGVLLSGGVDSSLITAFAVQASPKIRTFTIRFPGYGPYDETVHARLVARALNTEHTELEADPTTADLLPLLARQFDEPVVDSSMIPTFLVSRLVRRHCTVALGGDGGDELFGGYSHYSRLLWMRRRLGWLPRSLRRPVAAMADLLPTGVKGRNYLRGLGADWTAEMPLVTSLLDPRTRSRLLPKGIPQAAESVLRSRLPEGADLLQRATRMDFENYLAEDLLVKVDRSSMLNSLEVRAPFLDHRIIDFAFAKVPSALKATHDERKVLLKKIAAKLLPPAFDMQRKQGFSIPLGEWLKKGPWRELFDSVLLDPAGLFAPTEVRRLFEGQDRGRNNSERLFGLVLFELWRKEYGVSL